MKQIGLFLAIAASGMLTGYMIGDQIMSKEPCKIEVNKKYCFQSFSLAGPTFMFEEYEGGTVLVPIQNVQSIRVEQE